MSRYATATPEELELYQYLAKTRRKLYESMEQMMGISGNVARVHKAMLDLGKSLDWDEELLADAVRKIDLDD
jgi:hypothetical protein